MAPQAPQSAVPVLRVLRLLTNGSLPADFSGLPWLTVKEGADGGVSLQAEPQDCVKLLRKRAEELSAQRDTDRAQDCRLLALELAVGSHGGHDEGQQSRSSAAVEQVVSAMHAVHRLAEEAGRDAAAAKATSASADLATAALIERCVAAEQRAAAAEQRAASAEGEVAAVRVASAAAVKSAAAAEQRVDELAKELQMARPAVELLLQQHVRLQLRIGGDGSAAVPVLLPKSATAAELQVAAREAGAPPPCFQQLTVGGERLDVSGATPLTASQLLTKDAVVDVSWARCPTITTCGCNHVIVQLPDGEHVEWGTKTTGFDSARASAVCAGDQFTVSVAAGELKVWGDGERATAIRDGTWQLRKKKVVCCSARGYSAAAVTSDGELYLLGYMAQTMGVAVPSDLQGRVAAAANGFQFAVVITHEGTATYFKNGERTDVDLGGRSARSVHAGSEHYALLLDDGSVRCGGANDEKQCDVPSGLSDVVACVCGHEFTVALRSNGTLTWWGKVPCKRSIDEAGPIATIAAAREFVVVVTKDGRLVADGSGQNSSMYGVPPLAEGLRQRLTEAIRQAGG